VAVHRLNRTEYANAIEDILALRVDAAALLPADDVSDGFDNIASVLKVVAVVSRPVHIGGSSGNHAGAR
jgi:hypothetical protein